MIQTKKMETSQETNFSDLLTQSGPLTGGKDLVKALGYRSAAAFRQAIQRGTLPIHVFEIPGRRGRFALTSDIMNWLSDIKKHDKERDMSVT
ncbi:hypothetical protein [Undibacterium sp. Di27W]|uniref:hypothetical protein n=1 Tax=Undibacterium sp. Di27W TaxID=3413036 RepID=UPI003BF5E43C